MPRGRTASNLSLSARRERAYELYGRGYKIIDVARDIGVSADTASRYKKQYEASLVEEARSNPELLSDIIRNTVQAITELEQIRKEAWRRYEDAQADTGRVSFLNTALKAQEQKAKLFQLFGVKAEFMAKVAAINAQQLAFIQFLGEHNFCEHDREAIANFLMTQVDASDLDALATTADLPPSMS